MDAVVFLAAMFVVSLLFGLYVARIAALEREQAERETDDD